MTDEKLLRVLREVQDGLKDLRDSWERAEYVAELPLLTAGPDGLATLPAVLHRVGCPIAMVEHGATPYFDDRDVAEEWIGLFGDDPGWQPCRICLGSPAGADENGAAVTAVLDQAHAAEPASRIEFRDPIAAFGDKAIEPMKRWLVDAKLAAFSVRVLEKLAVSRFTSGR